MFYRVEGVREPIEWPLIPLFITTNDIFFHQMLDLLTKIFSIIVTIFSLMDRIFAFLLALDSNHWPINDTIFDDTSEDSSDDNNFLSITLRVRPVIQYFQCEWSENSKIYCTSYPDNYDFKSMKTSSNWSNLLYFPQKSREKSEYFIEK